MQTKELVEFAARVSAVDGDPLRACIKVMEALITENDKLRATIEKFVENEKRHGQCSVA